MERIKQKRLLLWLGIAVGMIVLVGVSLYWTGEPEFCESCHEMRPTVEGWRQAEHAKVSCFACHSDPGPIGYLKAHVVDGLRDVYVHLVERPDTIDDSFVPDSRCLACHEDEMALEEVADAHDDPPGYCGGCHREVAHANERQGE